MKRKIGKLFGVLVVGGSMMAHGSEPVNPQETKEEKNKSCQLEMVLSQFDDIELGMCPGITFCLDNKSDEEILTIVKEEREKDPCWCGMWLS